MAVKSFFADPLSLHAKRSGTKNFSAYNLKNLSAGVPQGSAPESFLQPYFINIDFPQSIVSSFSFSVFLLRGRGVV